MTKLLVISLLLMAALAMPMVTAAAQEGNVYTGVDLFYESKYNDPPLDEAQVNTATGGQAYFTLTTAGFCDMQMRNFVIVPYGEARVIHAQFGVNGKYDTRLPPGQYEARLYKGQGSGPDESTWKQEVQVFNVTAGGTVYINFIGACTSGTLAGPCVPHIDRAVYGAVECTQVLIEVIHYGCFNQGQCPGGYCWVGCGQGDYVWVPGHCAWGEGPGCGWGMHWVDGYYVYVPPYYHYESKCSGTYVDVLQELTEIVNNMHITSFVFDNALNPGGVWNLVQDTLLKEVDDPAPGIVKNVYITYLGCNGQKQNICGKEYEDIDLISGTPACPVQEIQIE